jgi:hypothetical protein
VIHCRISSIDAGCATLRPISGIATAGSVDVRRCTRIDLSGCPGTTS